MRQAAWALATGALWLCLALIARSQALAPIPPLTARVTDTTGTLTPQQKSTLEAELTAFEARKGAQLAVLIVPTTAPEEIEQYSIRAVQQWRLGRRNVDDGALLLIAKNDRRLRIEVGYGLEGALTDATSHRIISQTITPFLRQGDFYGGVNAGLAAMMKVVSGEPLPPPDPRWGARGVEGAPEGGGGLGGLIVLVFVGSMVLTGLFGRGLGSVLTAAGAALLVAITGHALLLVLMAAGGTLLFSLLFAAGRGRGGVWVSPGMGGFGGGFGGGMRGGGFGGGGLGGFSGGGGGFGGGGASGRW